MADSQPTIDFHAGLDKRLKRRIASLHSIVEKDAPDLLIQVFFGMVLQTMIHRYGNGAFAYLTEDMIKRFKKESGLCGIEDCHKVLQPTETDFCDECKVKHHLTDADLEECSRKTEEYEAEELRKGRLLLDAILNFDDSSELEQEKPE